MPAGAGIGRFGVGKRAASRAGALLSIVFLGFGVVRPAGRPAVAPPAAGQEGILARARFLMGTPLSIEASGPQAASAIEAAFEEVARLDRILSNWRADSELTRLNAEASRAPVPCSEDLFAVIAASLRWASETDGAFDPTIEPATWSHGLRGPDGRLPGQTPAPARGAAGPIGRAHVRLDRHERTVAFDAPGVGLDLGGIGKGFALDAAARILRAHGVGAALLDFGGELLSYGRGPDADGWKVGVASPDDRALPSGALVLRDASLATSALTERGRHILDPETGEPAEFEGSVTVLARDATTADALSTALFVMGPVRGLSWARTRGFDALFQYHDAEGALVRSGTGRFSGHPAARTASREER